MSRARILLVDDDPAVLESCRECLSYKGYTVTTATDLGEALREARAGSYELVITDKNLGAHRGVTPLLRYLQEERPDTKVLLFSAEDGARAREELPCTAFWNKFDEFDGFMDLVERLTA